MVTPLLTVWCYHSFALSHSCTESHKDLRNRNLPVVAREDRFSMPGGPIIPWSSNLPNWFVRVCDILVSLSHPEARTLSCPWATALILNSSPYGQNGCHFTDDTYSDAFYWMKSFLISFEFLWSLFIRVQLTISEHWFRLFSHYLNWHIYAIQGGDELTHSSPNKMA